MLKAIVDRYDIGKIIWELISCFYERVYDLEEAYCVPFISSNVEEQHGILSSVFSIGAY